jgi:acetyl esterase
MPKTRHWTKRLEGALTRQVGLGATHLPRLAVAAIGWRKRVTIDGRTLDPQLAAVLQMDELHGSLDVTRYPVRLARRKLEWDLTLLDLPSESGVDVRSFFVAGADGPLPARSYMPFGLRAPSPLVVFFHGGGMVTCGLDTHDAFCRRFVLQAGVRLISVDYRLAPEHPFPAAPDDAVASFRDIAARATELGADPSRLAVMGDSAGGNLSAVVSNRLAREAVHPALQVLIYPATELTGSMASHRSFGDGFLLTRRLIDWFMELYLPNGMDRTVPDASPLHHPDVSAVCPALIYTAGFDPLRDEGKAYADKLTQAGVRAWYRDFGSLVHGFLQLGGAIDAARDAVDEMAADVKAALK